jgi:hypothetical protein
MSNKELILEDNVKDRTERSRQIMMPDAFAFLPMQFVLYRIVSIVG